MLTLWPPGHRNNKFWLARGRVRHFADIISISTGCTSRSEAEAWLDRNFPAVLNLAAAKATAKTTPAVPCNRCMCALAHLEAKLRPVHPKARVSMRLTSPPLSEETLARIRQNIQESSDRLYARDEAPPPPPPPADPSGIKLLRERHHNLARLAAVGCSPEQIAALTDHDLAYVRILLDDPTFADLVGFYREKLAAPAT